MKINNKFTLLSICLFPLLTSCNQFVDASSSVEESESISEESYSEEELAFKDYSNKNDKTFNSDLFYRNDLELDMGDPMLVYDDATGYFYAYGTRGTTTIQCFRSTNLKDWTQLPDAFVPASDSWSKRDLWAPDIHKINGKWYLYYTAAFDNNGTSNCQMGVAVSDYPYGPYIQVPGYDGTIKTTPFEVRESSSKYCTVLDQHVFVDDDGSMYLYFSYDMKKCRDVDYHGYPVAEIWGCKMTSPTSWDFSTLTRLGSPGFAKLSDTKRTVEWETWSTSFSGDMECMEGPYMIKRNGKYYLTYVANSYVDTVYNVGYMVSSSPFGEYIKPNSYPLENMLLGVPGNDGTYINTRYLGFQTGTGHASICQVGDDYLFAYHAHRNRNFWGVDDDYYRCLGFDYLYFDENDTPYTRGPTYSINRLPNAITGYHNLCLDKDTTKSGSSSIVGLDYLFDNHTYRGHTTSAFQDIEVRSEADFVNSNNVTVSFKDTKTIKFILVTNSYTFSRKLDFIEKIDFGNHRVVKDVLFNQGYHRREPNTWIFPHSAFVIELENEIQTNEITFTFNASGEYSLGEIEIFGR